jgi:hypothetical protein
VAIFCQTKRIFVGHSTALWSKKPAKYGRKWAFLGQTACHLTIYKKLIKHQLFDPYLENDVTSTKSNWLRSRLGWPNKFRFRSYFAYLFDCDRCYDLVAPRTTAEKSALISRMLPLNQLRITLHLHKTKPLHFPNSNEYIENSPD